MPGYVEVADSLQVSGWCLQAETLLPDRVVLYVDGREVAQIPCTLPRPDLKDAGFGTGYGGFHFRYTDYVDPQKVVVRALSSGEVLPWVADAEEKANGYVSPFRKRSVIEPIYAISPTAAPVFASARSDNLEMTVAARALVPRDAILAIVPATTGQNVQVSGIEGSEIPTRNLPEGAPHYRELYFRVTVTGPHRLPYIGLNLIDENPDTAYYRCNPINPVASMCIPLDFEWVTAFPGSSNIARTCGEAAGAVTPERFATGGLTTAYQLQAVANHFLGPSETRTILDWGIGCGRIAMPFKRVIDASAQIIGVDVDPVNVDWCVRNLSDIKTSVCDFFPPLELRESSVDIVYGISVMTHLTEGAQYAWLKELRRILRPGGLCLLSTHGEYAFLRLDVGSRYLVTEQLNMIGISDIVLDPNLGPKLDMKRYYRGTFQTRRQIEEQWSRFLNIIAYYPGVIGTFQDLAVLRKEC
jgi:SAM-dependent methyltransferase